MIRTQVYLTEELCRDIEIVARREKKPKAKVIRDSIEKGLAKKKPKQTAGEALLGLAELGEKLGVKGPTDLSTNHDSYYEEI